MSLWTFCCGMLSKFCIIAMTSSSILVGRFWRFAIRLPRLSQACSVGFKSGLCADHSIWLYSMWALWKSCMMCARCGCALSSWKRNPSPIAARPNGTAVGPNMESLYYTAFRFSSTTTRADLWFAVMAPQTMTDAPPNLCTAFMWSSRNRVPLVRHTCTQPSSEKLTICYCRKFHRRCWLHH